MELELKSQQNIDGFTQCICLDPATLLVELGPIEADHGRFFDICEKDQCLDKAFEICIERIVSFKTTPDVFNDMRETA